MTAVRWQLGIVVDRTTTNRTNFMKTLSSARKHLEEVLYFIVFIARQHTDARY